MTTEDLDPQLTGNPDGIMRTYLPRQRAAARALVDLAEQTGEYVEPWIRDLADQPVWS